MASMIDLCNRALASIAAGQITDLGEGSIEAREAARFASALANEVMNWAEWPWAITRSSLAEIINDRPNEWSHAYAVPNDMAQPIALRDAQDWVSTADCWPTAGPFPFPLTDAIPLRYLCEGNSIYCNVAKAVLVYASSTAIVDLFPPLVARAFELELAARLAIPLRKDTTLASQLAEAAERSRGRAIADQANVRVAPPARFWSEAAMARAGYGDAL